MSRTYTRADSRVEIRGFEARHYDALMNLVTLGTYPRFLRRVVRDMAIRPEDAILDLGAGTGRNACAMARRLAGGGRILGLDIGPEMLARARRRCRRLPNVAMERRRVEEPLPYRGEFDKVFIAFVLHGFVQEDRLRIVASARRALRADGRLLLLDWDEFEPERASWPLRLAFRHVECPLATDFVRRDWRRILAARGFGEFRVHRYYRGRVRLLSAAKREAEERRVQRFAASCQVSQEDRIAPDSASR